jgi:hypothetical protein
MFVDIELFHGVCVLHCKGRFVSGPEIDYMQSKLNDVKTMACTKVLADLLDAPLTLLLPLATIEAALKKAGKY